MPSHALGDEILSASALNVAVILAPGATVIAEPGAMNPMSEVRFPPNMGDR